MNGNPGMKIFIPFSGNEIEAFEKTTHLAIAAHQDDVEIMAQHGILACFNQKDSKFSAVIATDGSGSPRTGKYEKYTNQEMMEIRAIEQKKAAIAGDYAALFLLNFPSSAVKDPKERGVIDAIKAILLKTRPRVIYTHNPADKHETHIATSLRVITALKDLTSVYRPEVIYGCEVWRALDWVNDDEKIVLDVSERPALKAALLGIFDSQIEGGKRYDLAALGRYKANATFLASHDTDQVSEAIYAVDLTPLLDGGEVDDYMKAYLDRFSQNVVSGIKKLQGSV